MTRSAPRHRDRLVKVQFGRRRRPVPARLRPCGEVHREQPSKEHEFAGQPYDGADADHIGAVEGMHSRGDRGSRGPYSARHTRSMTLCSCRIPAGGLLVAMLPRCGGGPRSRGNICAWPSRVPRDFPHGRRCSARWPTSRELAARPSRVGHGADHDWRGDAGPDRGVRGRDENEAARPPRRSRELADVMLTHAARVPTDKIGH